MRLVLAGLFHLIPVLPFVQGRYFLGVAAIFFVALAYIKTNKLTAIIEDAEELTGGAPSPKAEKELAGLRVARNRWRALTFLKQA